MNALGLLVAAFTLALPLQVAESGPGTRVPIFGPQSFSRERGKPSSHTETFQLPQTAHGPLVLSVENGLPDGSQRTP